MSNGLNIGALLKDSPVMLAPMAGYTDLAYRTVIREMGWKGLAFTEMLNPRSAIYQQGKKAVHIMATSEADIPLGWQIYGHEPEIIAEAAAHLEAKGAQLIDINMGCPQRKIARRGDGAGLMKTPDLAAEIAKAVVDAVTIPVTAKIRLGWGKDWPAPLDIALKLQDTGIVAMTVHGRTGVQRFFGKADWDGIARIVQALPDLPIIGNGDIVSPESAIAMRDHTGCAGVMIARCALGNPWIIRDASEAMLGNDVPPRPAPQDWISLMLRQLDLMFDLYEERIAVVLFRKWVYPYGKTLRLSRELKQSLATAGTLSELRQKIEDLAAVLHQ